MNFQKMFVMISGISLGGFVLLESLEAAIKPGEKMERVGAYVEMHHTNLDGEQTGLPFSTFGWNVKRGSTLHSEAMGVDGIRLRLKLAPGYREFKKTTLQPHGIFFNQVYGQKKQLGGNAYVQFEEVSSGGTSPIQPILLNTLPVSAFGPFVEYPSKFQLRFKGKEILNGKEYRYALINQERLDGTFRKMRIYNTDPEVNTGRVCSEDENRYCRVGMSVMVKSLDNKKYAGATGYLTDQDTLNLLRNAVWGKNGPILKKVNGKAMFKYCISDATAQGIELKKGLVKLQLARVKSSTNMSVVKKIEKTLTDATQACIEHGMEFLNGDLVQAGHIPFELEGTYSNGSKKKLFFDIDFAERPK